MRLYRILGAAWAGTQADAKAAAKDAGAPWHEYDVPTDKSGLLVFLNERNVPAQVDEAPKLESKRVPLLEDPLGDGSDYGVTPVPPTPISHARQSDFTADDIEDFILSRASVAQVENIFACLGTRVAELARQRKAA